MELNFNKYTSIGSSTLRHLDSLEFRASSIIGGATIVTGWHPINARLDQALKDTPFLLILAGGNDLYCDVTLRPRGELIEPMLNELNSYCITRSQAPLHVRETGLIFVLPLPRYASRPENLEFCKYFSDRAENLLYDARRDLDLPICCVNTSEIHRAGDFLDDDVHLSHTGQRKLLQLVQRETSKLSSYCVGRPFTC